MRTIKNSIKKSENELQSWHKGWKTKLRQTWFYSKKDTKGNKKSYKNKEATKTKKKYYLKQI
jgi:hypothetical protein